MNKKEIENTAFEKKVSTATIDKGWALGHLLNAFYSFEDIRTSFVFKGGTCLKKCYFEDYRFSEDLDFTLLDRNFPVNREFINRIIKIAEIKSEIRFFLSEINKQFYNDIPQGYEVKIKFWGADHNPNSTIPPPKRWQTFIKLDISFSEKILAKPVLKEIIHTYSDSESINQRIPCYSLAEIMAEKLRSLIQRNRPRDIYDIWYIMNSDKSPDNKIIKDLLIKKSKTEYTNDTNCQ